MSYVKAGIIAIFVLWFLGENRTILDDVAADSGFLTWFDLLAYYGTLIFGAYVVFVFSEHFTKEAYDGTKRHQKVSQHLTAILAAFVTGWLAFVWSDDVRSGELDHVKNVALGVKTFVFVATFSFFGVLSAHRQNSHLTKPLQDLGHQVQSVL